MCWVTSNERPEAEGRINARAHGQAAERFLLVLVLAAAAAAVAPSAIAGGDAVLCAVFRRGRRS
jgi:hypothetical protein